MRKSGKFGYFRRLFGLFACAFLLLANQSPALKSLRQMEKTVYTEDRSALFASLAPLIEPRQAGLSALRALPSARGGDESLTGYGEELYSLRLFGFLPLKEVRVVEKEERILMPGGMNVGIAIHTRGLLVVGMEAISQKGGFSRFPGRESGLRPGDLLLAANGKALVRTKDLLQAVEAAGEGELALQVLRGENTLDLMICPARDREGNLLLGLWLRESSAGIGTLSFYEEESGVFGALGHGITDVDLGCLLQLGSGSLCASDILGLTPGEKGIPGAIHGIFRGEKLGTVEKNTSLGVYGRMESFVNPLYPRGLPMAYPDEVVPGKAEILTSVDDSGIRSFSCEILMTDPENTEKEKGMLLVIDDPELLARSGGIVQGMSGSPIIQNGKLVGAVTHVLVNDPTRGYGIFIENMLDAAG